MLSINIVPRSNLSPTLPCQYISRIAHPSRFSSTLYIRNTMLFSFLKKLCTSSTGLFSIFHLSYIPSFMIPMLMIHPPPASSYSPFHVPQVFLLHFPSSSATAAFPPSVVPPPLFPSPPPLLRRLPYTPYLVFKTFVAIVVVVLLLLLLLLLNRQSSSVGNLT